MPSIDMQLLGAAALCIDTRTVTLERRKPLALIAYVAVEGRVSRARLAALLWPGLDSADARRNLRRELARLREQGAADVLAADADSVDLAPAVQCDARLLLTQDAAPAATDARFPAQGLLLAGFALQDAPEFDHWLDGARERVARHWRRALLEHAQAMEARGELRAALAVFERLHESDPLREVTVRDLMRLHAALRQRDAALRLYDRFAARLQADLGLAPLQETSAMAAGLRHADTPIVPQAAASAPPARGGHDPLPREAPFVGRAALIAQLQQAWRAGRLMLIGGEAGEGKTRLAADFAAAQGAYAHIACRPADRDTPFAAAARVLRALIEAAGDAPAFDAGTRHELARVLPELGTGDAPALASPAERQRFFAHCAGVVRQVADGNFNGIVLDDWHHADAASHELLSQVARQPGTRLRWLLVYRASELPAETAAAFDALVLDGSAAAIGVAPLAHEDVDALVRLLSGSEAPLFAQRLFQATGGNPFFLLETLRHLFERALVRVNAEGRWETPFDAQTSDYRELPVPATVRDAVRARVARLGVGPTRLLEAASLLGDPFAPHWLDDTHTMGELEAVAAFEAAEAARLLDADGDAYRFSHDLVAQSLQARLSPARAALLHRRLAVNLERAHVSPARIARHWEAAGEPRRAVVFRTAAGDAAARLYAHREALAEYTQALSDGPDAEQEARLRHARIEMWRHLGDIEARAGETEGLLQLARRTQDVDLETAALVQRALAFADLGRRRDALRAIEHAAALQPRDELMQLRVLRIAGWAAMACGESEQAQRYLERALPLAERIDAGSACSVLSVMCRNASDAGRYEEAQALHEQARTHVGLTVQPMVHVQVLTDGARVAEALGRRDEAIALQRQALAMSEKVATKPAITISRANLITTLVHGGRLEEARAEAALLPDGELRDPMDRYVAAMAGAQIAALEGRLPDAVRFAHEALQASDTLDDPLQRRVERVRLARLKLAAGDAAAAHALALDAMRIAPQPGRELLSAQAVRVDAEVVLWPDRAPELAQELQAVMRGSLLPEEERQAALDQARVVLGRAWLAAGHRDKAAEAVSAVFFSPALIAEAHAVAQM